MTAERTLASLIDLAPAAYQHRSPRLAEALLRDHALVAGGRAFRIEEVELYFVGGAHRDPFAHAHETQARPGRWYFHRSGQSFRGGSFKGLDLTFGAGESRGGALLRSLRADDGELVCGPSLCVDRVLAETRAESVAALDATLGSALDEASALHLAPASPRAIQPLRTARVGLTLKRHIPGDGRPRYLLRPDRWLTDPRAIKKGRVLSACALLLRGASIEETHRRTGSPRPTLRRWSDALQAGRSARELGPYLGRALRSVDLAALHGVLEPGPSAGEVSSNRANR